MDRGMDGQTNDQKENSAESRPLAHALAFDRFRDRGPRVLARGRGLEADRMVQIAKKSDLPVVSNGDFNRALEVLPLQEEIPEHLYRAAAAVFAFVYSLDSKQ